LVYHMTLQMSWIQAAKMDLNPSKDKRKQIIYNSVLLLQCVLIQIFCFQ
jgi:hypothetical protein